MNMFGLTLKELMKRDRVKISELSEAIGEPAKTIQEWIGPKGRNPRNLDVLPRIASFFKVSTHYLLFGQDDPHHALSTLLEKSEFHTGLYEITIKRVKEKKADK